RVDRRNRVAATVEGVDRHAAGRRFAFGRSTGAGAGRGRGDVQGVGALSAEVPADLNLVHVARHDRHRRLRLEGAEVVVAGEHRALTGGGVVDRDRRVIAAAAQAEDRGTGESCGPVVPDVGTEACAEGRTVRSCADVVAVERSGSGNGGRGTAEV